jgi:ABC-type bacteriocin/lantibiotic exporter with double-glycine peptidase domain
MLLPLLGFTQSDDSRCGVASVKSILYYFGIDKNENEIAIACNHSYELGCSNEDMAKALEHFGLGAKIFKNCTLNDLHYWNRHRVPVIVDFFTDNGHSGIVVDVNKDVYILDPWDGEIHKYSAEVFQRIWFDWILSETIQCDKLETGVMIVPYPKIINEWKTY